MHRGSTRGTLVPAGSPELGCVATPPSPTPCQTCSLPRQCAPLGYAAWPVSAPWGDWSLPALVLSLFLGLGTSWGAQKPQAPWGSGAVCLPSEPLCGVQQQGDSPAPEGRARVLGTGACGGFAPAGSSSCTVPVACGYPAPPEAHPSTVLLVPGLHSPCLPPGPG